MEDIFSNVELSGSGPAPSGAEVKPAAVAHQGVVPNVFFESESRFKWWWLIGAVALIAVLIAAAYVWFKPVGNNANFSPANNVGLPAPSLANDSPVMPPVVPSPESAAIKDSDSDGLTDNEEQALGTDALATDTDKDGLFDGEEVKVYKTNPLNPDSDNDGYTDGEEVKNGYNPVGPGRLLQLPTTAENQ